VKTNKFYFVFIYAFLIAIASNEINLFYVKRNNPENITKNTKSTVEGFTIYSIDNMWYLPQIENIIDGSGLTINPDEPEYYVKRTPGYSLFYGIHYVLFGKKYSFLLIRYIQLILFAISAFLLTKTVFNISKKETPSFIVGILYASMSWILGYAYFTITESLYPALCIFFMYFASLYYKSNQLKYLVISGIISGIALLTKPLSFTLLIPIALYLLFSKNMILKILVFGVGMSIVMLPWIIRNYIITKELIVFEKFYHEAPMEYGRASLNLRKLVSCWENPAESSGDYFSAMLYTNENADLYIDKFIEQCPEYAFQGFTKEELRIDLVKLNACLYDKYSSQQNSKHYIPRAELLNRDCDFELAEKFKIYAGLYKKERYFSYYILTPLNNLIKLVFQSNTSNLAMLNPKGSFNLLQIMLKGVNYIFHSLLFMFFIVFLFLKTSVKFKLIVSIPVIFHLFVFVFYFRIIESRYLMAVYPLLAVSFVFVLIRFNNCLNLKFKLWKSFN